MMEMSPVLVLRSWETSADDEMVLLVDALFAVFLGMEGEGANAELNDAFMKVLLAHIRYRYCLNTYC